MPEKPRKPKKRKKPFVTNGVAIDVDPDKKDIVPYFQKEMHIFVPIIDVVRTSPWKEADRKYFFDHFTESWYARLVSEDERMLAEEQAMREAQLSLAEVEQRLGPFFRKVLVMNLSPGFRFRVSIDRIDRKPDQVSAYAGHMGSFPVFKPLHKLCKDVVEVWADAILDYEAERESK